MNRMGSRVDLPPRETAFEPTAPQPGPTARAVHEPRSRLHEPDEALASAEHLGAYGPMIRAIRSELEHFIVSHVRLHLAIADRDRFLLTSIAVRCTGGGPEHDLLRQFMHEFKPEQVKRYLVREVISGLPNAAVMDLSQFAGLVDVDAQEDDREYGELLAALAGPSQADVPSYEVSILGRWSEQDTWQPTGAAAAQVWPAATPITPLAGQRFEFELEDADGKRRIVLPSVVPGRRYVVGKGEGCDIRVNGTYTSRRHAEMWIDHGTWWVSDAGSTNGIRIEPAGGPHERGGTAVASAADAPIKLVDGARMVLSARSEGPANDYPWIALRIAGSHASSRLTPIARAASPARTRATDAVFRITAMGSSGTSTVELRPGWLPVSVGRSRSQTLVVDRRHEAVSGHHLDIVELDDTAAHVVVHGDNGVLLDGVRHPPGSRLRWLAGQSLVLGASAHDESACTLLLVQTRPT
jgi:pSer/pThr/pTyr-binding forkhead associated (FHA) protein